MTLKALRVVHYVNQFFGGIGGEEQAGVGPSLVDRPVGPGLLIQKLLDGAGSVVATVMCGDNYFADDPEAAADQVIHLLDGRQFDLFLAGPAFNAGRYAIACGEMCAQVQDRLKLPAVTGMFAENPGVDLYRQSVHIIETGGNAADMGNAVPKMLALGRKLCDGYVVTRPADEGCFARGVAENVLLEKVAAVRAVDLLLGKMGGDPYETEIPFPDEGERIPPAPPVEDLKKATIALVTEGGLVPVENPDRLESSRATRYASYEVTALETGRAGGFESVHRGFDTTYINQDPFRLLPVDALREMESAGVFRKLYPIFFVTTGVATSLTNATKIGKGIAEELRRSEVSAAILTST